MSHCAPDRRSARTRASLQRALNALTLNKGYETISIKEICAEADVGRSTFYTHYTSKDDLKRSGFEHLRQQLAARQREAKSRSGIPVDGTLGFSLTMFEHARDHRELYQALVGGRGGTVALDAIRKMLSELIGDDLAATRLETSTEAVPHEFVVQFIVGAYMSIMTWWFDGGAKLAPIQLDAMFRLLVAKGALSDETMR